MQLMLIGFIIQVLLHLQGGFDGDLTGNAGSATQLQNARNIGGVRI